MADTRAGRSQVITTVACLAALVAVAVASIFLRGAPPVRAAVTPPAPAAPFALAGEASATVFWTAPAAGITSYTVQASPGGASATVSGSTLSTTISGLTDAIYYTFTVTATNGSGSSPASAPSPTVAPGLGAYVPLAPARILDTRPSSALGPGATRTVPVSGYGGVPSSLAVAVVLNVTAADATAAGYLTLWPTGTPRPTTSNINWSAGKTVANLVEIALGQGGQVSVFNGGTSNTDVVLDAEGYVAEPMLTPPAADWYVPVVPFRVVDTRIGLGTGKAQLCAGQTDTVTIAGVGVVPATGVTAVVMNVTSTNTVVAPSSWTVYPAVNPDNPPLASNLNFVPGQTVANRVIVKLGIGGAVSWHNLFGHADVVGDVVGYFTTASVPVSGARFVGVQPARILDTRSEGGTLQARTPSALVIAGHGGVPVLGAAVPAVAVVLNVTVTNPTAASFLTIYPAGAATPATSDLNYVPGLTVANLVVVKLGSSGAIDILNASGTTDVVVDVVGWYG